MSSSLQFGFSRVTEWEYAPDGGVLRQTLHDEATGDQVTRYEYGTTLAESGVAMSGLLVSKVLPTGDAMTLTYNRQGEAATMTDANGSVHEYRRDLLGRPTDDAVTSLAAGVDGVVRRLSTGYDVRGRVQSFSSHSAPDGEAGVVLNEVKFEYNGIDCLTADIQSHAGAVSVDTPRVQYTCTGAVDAVLRRKTVVYPNGRIVAYEYGDTGGIDDVLNRVQSMHDNDLTVLAEFRYLGAGTPAVTVLAEPGLERRWKALVGQPVGDAGDPYTGYDRFGRVENMLWWKPATSAAAVQVGWGYDRTSRRTWRRDVLANAALTAGGDQAFTYDALSQVRGRDVGRLNTNTTAIGGIPAQQEAFRYDEAGNWLGYELLADGAPQIEQTRVSNRSNQLTQVDGSSAGLSYDANGNMLTVPTGDELTGEPRRMEWDAWDRLRRVYDSAGVLLAEYEYDARTRRIVANRPGQPTRQIYYNDSWRSVEERQAVSSSSSSSSSSGSSSSSSGSGVPVPAAQYVWQPTSRWEMLLRDRVTTPGGTLDQRHYPLKDALDVVALSDAEGVVIERYSYSAFGMTTFMDAGFEEQGASAFGWEFLFHAEFRDAHTGWYDYGYRYYSTELGRWLSRDPIGEQGGMNLYGFVLNDPIGNTDVLGEDVYLRQGNAGAAAFRVGQRLHQEVCVDQWDGPFNRNTSTGQEACCSNNEWFIKSEERLCISFALDFNPLNWTPNWDGFGPKNGKYCGLYEGVVYLTGDQGTSTVKSFSTCCRQDIEIKERLVKLIGSRGTYGVDATPPEFENPDSRGLFPANQAMTCRNFSQEKYSELEGEFSLKSCNTK